MLRSPQEKIRIDKSEEYPHTRLQIGEVTYDLLTHVSEEEKAAIIQDIPGINPAIFSKIVEGPHEDLYKIVLGTGNFCKATLARKINPHTQKATYVAMKKLRRLPGYGSVPLFSQQLYVPTLNEKTEKLYSDRLRNVRAEIQLHKNLAALPLPHSIIIQDSIETTNGFGIPQIYQILPFVEHNGGTYLEKLWHANLTPEEHLLFFTYFANQLIKAIVELHTEQVYHRDLKPDNILVDHQGNIFIADFGLARCFPKNGMGPVLSISTLSYAPYILPYRHLTNTNLSFSDEGKSSNNEATERPDPYAHVSALSALQDAWSLGLILIQFWNKDAQAYLKTDLFQLSKTGFFIKKTKEAIHAYYKQMIENIFSEAAGYLNTMPSALKNLCHDMLLAGLNTITNPEEAKQFSFIKLINEYQSKLPSVSLEEITGLCSRISMIDVKQAEKKEYLDSLKIAQQLVTASDLQPAKKEQLLNEIANKLIEVASDHTPQVQLTAKPTLAGTLFHQKTDPLIKAVSDLLYKGDKQSIKRIKQPAASSSGYTP